MLRIVASNFQRRIIESRYGNFIVENSTPRKKIRTKTEELRTLLEKEKLLSQTVYKGKVEGSGALAQGKGATAAGAGGIAVGGNVTGNVTTGGK